MKNIRSHDENRAIVCAACGKKDTKCSKVTPSIESAIQAEISNAYSTSNTQFPTGRDVQKKGDIWTDGRTYGHTAGRTYGRTLS